MSETTKETITNETATNETTNEATNGTTQGAEGTSVVKWACVLAYILFFLPLVVEGDKTVHKFHANQGLVLLLLSFAVGLVGSIPFIGWFVVLPVGSIYCLVCMIMGMVNAGNDNMKELPLIGKIKIIK